MKLKKNIIITSALYKSPQKKLINGHKKTIFSTALQKELSSIKNKEEIHIYDLGFNNQNNIIPINNHINKTGINPLREQQSETFQFYDITNIYEKQVKGKIAECFGKKTNHTN